MMKIAKCNLIIFNVFIRDALIICIIEIILILNILIHTMCDQL